MIFVASSIFFILSLFLSCSKCFYYIHIYDKKIEKTFGLILSIKGYRALLLDIYISFAFVKKNSFLCNASNVAEENYSEIKKKVIEGKKEGKYIE